MNPTFSYETLFVCFVLSINIKGQMSKFLFLVPFVFLACQSHLQSASVSEPDKIESVSQVPQKEGEKVSKGAIRIEGVVKSIGESTCKVEHRKTLALGPSKIGLLPRQGDMLILKYEAANQLSKEKVYQMEIRLNRESSKEGRILRIIN